MSKRPQRQDKNASAAQQDGPVSLTNTVSWEELPEWVRYHRLPVAGLFELDAVTF